MHNSAPRRSKLKSSPLCLQLSNHDANEIVKEAGKKRRRCYPVTSKQKTLLEDLGYETHPVFTGQFDGVYPPSQQDATDLIEAIIAHNKKATPAQIKLLQELGVETPPGMTKTAASARITEAFAKRRRLNFDDVAADE